MYVHFSHEPQYEFFFVSHGLLGTQTEFNLNKTCCYGPSTVVILVTYGTTPVSSIATQPQVFAEKVTPSYPKASHDILSKFYKDNLLTCADFSKYYSDHLSNAGE